MKKKFIFAAIPVLDYEKLERIVNSGKYRTKVDFLCTKIREEKVNSDE